MQAGRKEEYSFSGLSFYACQGYGQVPVISLWRDTLTLC